MRALVADCGSAPARYASSEPSEARERGVLRKVLLGLWLVSTISGFLFASYGVLRESFADLTQSRGYGEGRFGEGPYGRGLTTLEDRLVRFGIKCGLLPADRVLTITDRKRNAAWAIAGVLLIGLSIAIDVVLKFLPDG